MLSDSALIAFVATSKPDEARRFYVDSLGFGLLDESPAAIVLDANGVMLRVQKVQSHVPAPYTVLGWQVADIFRSIDALASRGITFERFAGFSQDERGVWTSPDGARVAWFRDPDGNTLSLTQFPG